MSAIREKAFSFAKMTNDFRRAQPFVFGGAHGVCVFSFCFLFRHSVFVCLAVALTLFGEIELAGNSEYYY